MLYLYHLKRRGSDESCVVIAPDTSSARTIAGLHAGGEGWQTWHISDSTSCECIGQALEETDRPALVCRSYRAG
ncbi:MAG: hypothetical protein EBS68_17590 [Rhodobacteraceae bacterium]|jgi:hypothetical protein|nr:hypothetical protein [Paracoccaceae bacterium]